MFRIVALATVLALAGEVDAVSIVYNNTTSPTGVVNPLLASGQIDSLEHGSQVTLAGSERIVTNFVMRMRAVQPGACVYEMRVRFFKNDGSGGMPGTVLWDSGWMNRVIDSGFDMSYFYNVPNIRVPGTFTWAVTVRNRQGSMGQMGPPDYSPPTVGSAPFGYWRNNGGGPKDWQFTGETEAPFAAQIQANPIPGDVNHNAVVDIDDLVSVITSWGSPCANCPATPCPADATGDCQVNIDDLVRVITNWG